MNRPDDPSGAPVGLTLVEVLVALCLVGAVGVVASGAAESMTLLARAARSEAAGLAAASAKLEELIASPSDSRASGNDATVVDGLSVTRIWRVRRDDPASGLTRLEVTARWSKPSLTLLTLAAVAP